MKGNSKKEKTCIVIGSLLILIGVLCNEWILAVLFSPDGELESPTRIKILIFDLFLITSGLIILIGRRCISTASVINLKNLGLSFVTVLLCFIVSELCLRIWLFHIATPTQFSYYALYEEVKDENRIFSPHHYLNYCTTSNFRSRDGLNKHNSLGYRGEEIITPKPQGIFRIAVLGGSSAYTQAVKDYKKSFTVLMQNILREEYGYSNIEVVNAAVGGYSSWESLINLEFRVLDIEPDLLIIYHGTNDVHTRLLPLSLYRGDNSGRRKQWSIPERKIWDRIVFLRILNDRLKILPSKKGLGALVDAPTSHAGVMAYDKRIGGDPTIVLDNNPPKYFERNLRNMIAIAKEHNIQIILSTWAHSPLFQDYASTRHYEKGFAENNDVVRSVAKKHNIPLFDFAKSMPIQKEFWGDGRHVNEEGALVKAKIFAEFLHSQRIFQGSKQ